MIVFDESLVPEELRGPLREYVEHCCCEAVAAERARCLRVVRSQPYYPDTHTGARQQWVKDQIAERIEAGEV